MSKYGTTFPTSHLRSNGFVDGNGTRVEAGDNVEYRFGGNGVVLEVFQDGDASVYFTDKREARTVKWTHLCKVPAAGPNQRKLEEKLTQMYAAGMKNIHIDWAPGAAALSTEERAATVLVMLEEAEKRQAKPEIERMRDAVVTAYEMLVKAMRAMPARTVREFVTLAEEGNLPDLERENTVRHNIDFAMLHLGNWISNEDRRRARA